MGSVWLDPGRHGHAPPHAPTHVMAAEVTARVSRGEGPDLTGRESRQMRHLINAQQWLPSLDAQPSMFGTWDTQRRRTLPCPGHRWLLLSPPDFLCFPFLQGIKHPQDHAHPLLLRPHKAVFCYICILFGLWLSPREL